MVWISDDGLHRGQALRLEGTEPLPPSARDGRRVDGIAEDSQREIHMPVQGPMPSSATLVWRGICNCGWRGKLLWLEAGLADANDTGSTGSGTSEASRSIDDGIHEEWRDHLPAPGLNAAAALAALEMTADEYRQARRHLETKVAEARAAGASWAQIGPAAGISRKAAYKRWGYQSGMHSP